MPLTLVPNPSAPALCEAIRSRRLLELEYKGLPRVLAPYCHGWGSDGAEMLRAIQVRGASRSGLIRSGKLWKVREMKRVRMLAETFVADDPDYNPDDTAMPRIHCRV